MATEIYEIEYLDLLNGKRIELSPLKIKYLRQFMNAFENVKQASDDEDAIRKIAECATICMQQYYPEIDTVEKLEDVFSLPDIYKVLDAAAGIKLKDDKEESVTEQVSENKNNWSSLDLAKLEAEIFLLGIWKDYDELEKNISMPELVAILDAKREQEHNERKFLAAIQGIDLDKQQGKSKDNAWEKMKAKVFSGGKATNPNDVTALQGYNAQKAGFGIGMGLDYVDLTKK